MDPAVDVLHGPNPVQKNGAVTVPRELLHEVGIDPLDGAQKVHWALNPDIPGTLLLIPSALVSRTMTATLDALRTSS